MGDEQFVVHNTGFCSLSNKTKQAISDTLNRADRGEVLSQYPSDGTEFENRVFQDSKGEFRRPIPDRGGTKGPFTEFVVPTDNTKGASRLVIDNYGNASYFPNHYEGPRIEVPQDFVTHALGG